LHLLLNQNNIYLKELRDSIILPILDLTEVEGLIGAEIMADITIILMNMLVRSILSGVI
jgi:hypothetical protein